jgi:rhamnulose-1-phosphate aldolase
MTTTAESALTALQPILDDVAAVAGFLWQRGWAERNAGNLSIDVTDVVADVVDVRARSPYPLVRTPIPDRTLAGRWFLVTATGSRFRDLQWCPDGCLLLLQIAPSLVGYRVAWGDEGWHLSPTSELVSHLRIHATLRTQESAHRVVLHTHPTHLIALSHAADLASEEALNRVLWGMVPEVKVFVPEGVGLAPYRLPGTEALADVTVAALARHRVIMWEKHGCLAVERNVQEAFDLIDTLDKAARIYLLCRAAGFTPQGLSDEAVRDLDDLSRRLGPAP